MKKSLFVLIFAGAVGSIGILVNCGNSESGNAPEPGIQATEPDRAKAPKEMLLAAAPKKETAKPAAGKPAKSAAELEKEKALQNPYPNDFGSEKLTDEELKAYSPELQEAYKKMAVKCSACHAPSRPLNSQFVEGGGKDKAARSAHSKKLKEQHKDELVWQIEANIWERYVKRMSAKPGCNVGKDAKAIWQFLVADSLQRKTGANAKKWEAHRRKLLAEFKEKHPSRYKELFGAQSKAE